MIANRILIAHQTYGNEDSTAKMLGLPKDETGKIERTRGLRIKKLLTKNIDLLIV